MSHLINRDCARHFSAWRRLGMPSQLALFLLLFLMVELLTAWPYGHIALARHLTELLPLSWWQIVTTFGDARWPLAFALLLALRDRQILWVYLLALLLGWLSVRGMKLWFHIPRPGTLLPALDVALTAHEAKGHNSFPSSHVMVAFSFVTVLAHYKSQRWLWGALGGAFLIAFSRIGIGAHWPIDVLGGALVGVLSASLAAFCVRRSGYTPGSRSQLVLMILVAAAVATMPWIDSGYLHTRVLRMIAAGLGMLAVGLQVIRRDVLVNKRGSCSGC